MEQSAEIGSTIVIKGEVTAREDLVISGRIEGSIEVVGHSITVNPGAKVAADIQARAIVVAGQVKGTMSADERVELASTAAVEGEISAPVLRMDDGAVFRGRAATTRDASRPDLQLAS